MKMREKYHLRGMKVNFSLLKIGVVRIVGMIASCKSFNCLSEILVVLEMCGKIIVRKFKDLNRTIS